jgi:protein-disulfide isomerase/uncharacterized membrane protein
VCVSMQIQTTESGGKLIWKITAIIFIILGNILSANLLMRHFDAVVGKPLQETPCRAIFGTDCGQTVGSDLATQFGIPLGGWGLVHFTTVASLLFISFAIGPTFQTEGASIAIVLCSIATIFGVILTWLMLSGSAPFCPLCFLVHFDNLLLISVIKLSSGQSWSELSSTVGSGIRYFFGGSVENSVLARWKTIGIVTSLLVGIVMFQWVLIQTDRRSVEQNQPLASEDVIAQFNSTPRQEIPVNKEDPQIGSQEGSVQLVIFSDFQCSACQLFSHTLSHLREHGLKVFVVFKHYPLEKKCNASIDSDLHPLSCQAAYAAEAAKRQGKFWEYQDLLFESSEKIDETMFKELAEKVGLNMEQFEKDLADTSIKTKIQEDIKLGDKLEIEGTPTLFLNGKLVPDGGISILERLVRQELIEPEK